MENFLRKLIDEVEDLRIEKEKTAKCLPHFLSKLFKEVAKESAFDEPKLKLANQIHQKVAQGLKQLVERESPLAA